MSVISVRLDDDVQATLEEVAADVVRNPGRVSSATDIGVPAVWRIGSVV